MALKGNRQRFLTMFKKWGLLGILLLMCCAFFYFKLYKYCTFDALKIYEADIQAWTENHYKTAVAIYIGSFIITIACTIPSATFLSLVGGFLFGSIAILYAIAGTTLGGMMLFIAVRTAIGSSIAQKSSGWAKKLERGFQENAFYYLLTLRLMPIFPCWISNITAGALNVPIKTFIVATIIGITPATVVYVMAGRSLDKLLAAGDTVDMHTILTPSILLPLIGLAIMSLLPVIYKKFKQ